jgi:hypothetical protein
VRLGQVFIRPASSSLKRAFLPQFQAPGNAPARLAAIDAIKKAFQNFPDCQSLMKKEGIIFSSGLANQVKKSTFAPAFEKGCFVLTFFTV